MQPVELPQEPIDRLIAPLERFLHVEAAGGVVLLACTAAALALANSPAAEAVHHFWQTAVGIEIGPFQMRHSLEHWINDGLMVLFFFVVGLEVKRELVLGELRDPRRASLPLIAALGGMLVPAGIYLTFQAGQPAERGWGIPMATDIAFVVGCMAVLGPRIPAGLRIMLLSLAIADDIGAILVIAVGYSAGIHTGALLLAVLGVGVVVALQRLGVRSFLAYTVTGVFVWVALHHSGIHATLAGVALGLMTPARPYLGDGVLTQLLQRVGRPRTADVRTLQRVTRELVSPLEYLEATLHPWVGFVIMPLFALANAGVVVEPGAVRSPVALAVATGLVLGKPIGIVTFSWVAVRMGLARLPDGTGWGALTGGGLLCGIGFTMALFIAGLALAGQTLDAAKVGILGSSAVAALAGMATLLVTLPPPRTHTPQH